MLIDSTPFISAQTF